jgi:predicted RNA-binding Zn-ribbon protein involved in translation (DUF1610 family)
MAYIDINETEPFARSQLRSVLSECPDCAGELAILRVIGGRAGCEYWTMRCTDCGGIHLDILKPHDGLADNEGPLPAA